VSKLRRYAPSAMFDKQIRKTNKLAGSWAIAATRCGRGGARDTADPTGRGAGMLQIAVR
jgi:hypothetical protein